MARFSDYQQLAKIVMKAAKFVGGPKVLAALGIGTGAGLLTGGMAGGFVIGRHTKKKADKTPKILKTPAKTKDMAPFSEGQEYVVKVGSSVYSDFQVSTGDLLKIEVLLDDGALVSANEQLHVLSFKELQVILGMPQDDKSDNQ